MTSKPLILLECWRTQPHSLPRLQALLVSTPEFALVVVFQDTGDIGQHIPSSEPIRCPRRSARFVSPLKIGHTRPLPDSAKVVALRERILSDPARFGSANIIEVGISAATASDIASLFTDGSMTKGLFIDAFINLILHDEQEFSPMSAGDRIFLPTSVSNLLNCDYLDPPLKADFNEQCLAEHLREVLPPAKDLQSWKMVIVPVIHHSHWTLYCVNRNHGRIDVFDSNNYPALNTEYKDHHGDLGSRVVKRLSDRLYAAARTAFKRFGNQKLVRNKCPVMLKPNDCAFFVMRYMELYEGDDSPLIQVAESEEYNDLRSQMLYNMVFHSNNVAAPLPPELEEL
uniref:Ubiquitin-like protease family profile domain-containing protein n=1 Tax=Oryza rufipogon TaxID=4529 RepID=A0A0E0R3J5_ORYRU